MENEISVIVRVMPSTDEIELSIPSSASPKDLIDYMLDADLGIPKLDGQSNRIVYQLIPKGKNEVLHEEKSFKEEEIQDDDVILMIPKIIAG